MSEHALSGAQQAGLAYVAATSFLASRILPTGGFAVALAGGTALARVGEREGLRRGYGASLAAMVQTVAVLGPARIGVPLTQALSAPLLGRMLARGRGQLARFAACAAIRASDQVATTAFFIWIIVGGLDAYAGSYDAFLGDLLPDGATPALVATAIGLVLWTVFASAVQVVVYERALRDWPHPPETPAGPAVPAAAAPRPRGSPRFDPRAVSLAAGVAFVALVADLSWTVLGALGAWLAVAWLTARPEREPVRSGLVLAALLAASALTFGLVGGIGVDETLRRTVRAALLVLVATWLRAAAGEEGLRDVARRLLGRVRAVPAMGEAAATLDALGAARGLEASGRALGRDLAGVRKRPLPLAYAVLGWVAGEAARFRPPPPTPRARLRAAAPDRLLVLAAVTAALAAAL